MTQPPKKRRGRRPRWRRWIVQLLIIVGILAGIQLWQKRGLLSPGVQAPGFDLRSLDGQQVTLVDYRGKTVLLQFWATWCGVCKADVPSIKSLNEALSGDEALLSIAVDSDPEAVRRFVKEEGIRYPVLLGTRKVMAAYEIEQLPTAYVIDAAGEIASRDVGWSSSYGHQVRMDCAR
jgi:peroxiredoxin